MKVAEKSPIATSPVILLLLSRIIKKELVITKGSVKNKGDFPKTRERAAEPKATWDKPSPIKEILFKTKKTPKKAEGIERKKPTKKALKIKS